MLECVKFITLSTSLEAILQAGHTEVENKIDAAIHDSTIERIESVISIPAISIGRESWGTLRASLDKIVALIAYYELKDATTILELALWKAKIDQADETNRVNHDAYRIDVPGPVKDTILQYLC